MPAVFGCQRTIGRHNHTVFLSISAVMVSVSYMLLAAMPDGSLACPAINTVFIYPHPPAAMLAREARVFWKSPQLFVLFLLSGRVSSPPQNDWTNRLQPVRQ